jgi:hypothetical protein
MKIEAEKALEGIVVFALGAWLLRSLVENEHFMQATQDTLDSLKEQMTEARKNLALD